LSLFFPRHTTHYLKIGFLLGTCKVSKCSKNCLIGDVFFDFSLKPVIGLYASCTEAVVYIADVEVLDIKKHLSVMNLKPDLDSPYRNLHDIGNRALYAAQCKQYLNTKSSM